MKKLNENICKFVPYTSSEQIITTNFVYETNAENFDKMTIKKNHSVYLVANGSGRLYTEFHTYDLQPGTVFFTFAATPHRIENTGNIQYMYITFNGNRSQELFERFQISPVYCVFKGHEGLFSFWQNCLGKANEKNLDLISESVLLYTFSQMVPVSQDSEEYLTGNILKYIEAHFTDSSLSLASASEALGYNSKYISRVFKQNIGITFSEYLKNTRIQHATFLMEQGITAVKNVAFLSGYSDPFYFSNVFRQTVGISPSEYIESKK